MSAVPPAITPGATDHVADHAHDHGHDAGHDHAPYGWRRWLYATNHKDIGTMYLWFSFTMFIFGGILALGLRLELFQPGLQFWRPEFFNQLTTMHGLIMVFGAIMPAFVGFANWQVPLMVGAPDMAFARMNNFSFWLLPPAALLLVASFFVPGGATAAGWTLYAPLTVQMGPGMDLAIFALHIMGASSIMGSINIITTILNMRAPGMTLMKMPMFVWTWLITAYLLIAVMPVLAGAITMTLTDRHFRHQLLQCGRRRRPGDVPAHFLVLRAPRGLHHDFAGLRNHLAGDSGVRAQAAVRLCIDGLCDGVDCDSVVHGVGASYVHDRHAGHRAAVLHVRDDADCRAHGGEGVQLDCDDVSGLDDIRDADAVCDRLHLRVHDGRIHRADPGGGAYRYSRCRTRTTSLRTFTMCWWPGRCSRCLPARTTGCRSGPAICTTRSSESGTSGCR